MHAISINLRCFRRVLDIRAISYTIVEHVVYRDINKYGHVSKLSSKEAYPILTTELVPRSKQIDNTFDLEWMDKVKIS